MLLAVHISDGVLTAPWLAGGFVVAALLLFLGSRRIRDEEITTIALLTAAFFVSSSIHVPAGPSSVHLLLTGLVGVILLWRSFLAITVGLLLQAILLHHGGYLALGVNICVMAVPALACGLAYRAIENSPCLRWSWFRGLLVGGSTSLWLFCVAFTIFLWRADLERALDWQDVAQAVERILQLKVLLPFALIAAAAIWAEARLENIPAFSLGLFLGSFSVLLTLALNALLLKAAGADNFDLQILLVVMANLPLAGIEGVIMGFTLAFLTKVKPSLLRTGFLPPREITPPARLLETPVIEVASPPR